MLEISEVFECFEDIFDSSCQATVFTSPHFETINIVEDLSVEEDGGMTKNLKCEAIIDEFLSSIDNNRLETPLLDEELLTSLYTLIDFRRRLPIGDTLPNFGDWFV